MGATLRGESSPSRTLEGITAPAGDINFISSDASITITADDAADTINFVVTSSPSDGDWTIVGSDMNSTPAGNIGIGVAAASTDEKVHIAKSVDGGDIALLIENSFTNTATSIDETVSIKFGFGGNNNAALIQAGKISDFSIVANEDAFLAFSVKDNGTLTEVMRLKGGASIRVGIGITIPEFPFDINTSSPVGAVVLRVRRTDSTAGPEIRMGGSNLNAFSTIKGNGSSFDIKAGNVNQFGHSFREKEYIIFDQSTGVEVLTLTTTKGIKFTVGGPSDPVGRDNNIMAADGTGGSYPFNGRNLLLMGLSLGGGPGFGDIVFMTDNTGGGAARKVRMVVNIAGNVGIGPITASAVIDEKFHVFNSVDGGDVAALIENSFTNTAASTDETVSLKFGFGSNNNAGLIRVGKVNDFVATGNRDSFMAFSVLNGDVVTEAIRIDNVGNVGIGTSSPQAKLEVGGNPGASVGGFPSGNLHVTGQSASVNANAVITGHNLFGGNKQLWYLGSTSSSSDAIAFINRQNAPLSLSTNSTTRLTIEAGGDVGIGTTAASAQLHVDQPSTTGAQPVLLLDQADVSEEFTRYIGSAAAGVLTQSIVNDQDVTTKQSIGYLRVFVQDDGNQITDQAYYVEILTLA